MPILSVLFACAGTPDMPTPDVGAATEAVSSPVPTGAQHFGAAFAATEKIDAASLLADPASHVGQTVQVQGRVADVCQKQGCWMVLAEGEHSIRIRMKDHSFSVGKDGTGSLAVVEGQVVEVANDPKEAEHLASESKNPGALSTATGAVTYEIVATGVEYLRG